MSSSELKYLIAANELSKTEAAVKQSDIANKLHVSKVSAYKAIERLKEKGFIEKNERKVVLTTDGKRILGEYMIIIRFISAHLSLHCGTPSDRAYDDALSATCAFSDETRNGVANFIQSEMAGVHHESRI